MTIIKIRFKKGIRRKIKDTQKEYYYVSRFDELEVGDHVVVDVKLTHQGEDFKVGRVEEVISDENEINGILEKYKPYGLVICKLPYDFEARCIVATKIKFSMIEKYKN